MEKGKEKGDRYREYQLLDSSDRVDNRGRPRLSDDERRCRRLVIRLTIGEWEILSRRAGVMNEAVSVWCRKRLFERRF